MNRLYIFFWLSLAKRHGSDQQAGRGGPTASHTERTAPDSDEPRSLSPVHVAVTGFVWFTPRAGQHLNQCHSSWRPLPPPQATFRAPAADAHAAPRQPQRYMIFNPKSAATKLPSEWFAASPPLCSWGARTKTPRTFFVMCGREIKAASFILMFNSPSSPPLFGYTVWPLLRNGRGVGLRGTFCSRKKKKRDWIIVRLIRRNQRWNFVKDVMSTRRGNCRSDNKLWHVGGETLSLSVWYDPDCE